MTAPDTPAIGSEEWLAAQGAVARPYHGAPYVIDVVVNGDRSGEGVTYHISLEDGVAPRFGAGPAPVATAATLELTRSDAEAQRAAGVSPVVGYMRGTTKTKGATRPLYELFRLFA